MQLNKFIDHTLLKSDATEGMIRALCDEAREYDFASVCVNSAHVPLAAELLKGSSVAVCAVVGFPLGAMLSEAKAFEAALAVALGANEVDMVMDIGAAKAGDFGRVARDIAAVVKVVHPAGAVKVIIECCLLSDEEKRLACLAAMEAGADFVKTSTGFSSSGATEADVRLMRETVGERLSIKAAGGIRTREDALRFISAGADRIGTSAGVRIIKGQ